MNVNNSKIQEMDQIRISEGLSGSVLVLREVMKEAPQHWGRFTYYVHWLGRRKNAYDHFRYIMKREIHLIPHLTIFIYHSICEILCTMYYGR